MSIFFLCNIGVQYYAVLYGENISRCTLAGQNKPRWILLGHFGRLLEAPYPPVSDFTRLFSPVERRQSGSVVFIDVRGAKNEDLTHWFKHVKQLWKCVPLPHAFSSQPSWCSSVSNFFCHLFYCFALFVWYDIHVIIGKRSLPRRFFFFTLHRGCDGASFWEMWISWSARWSAEHGTTQVQWNPSLGSDQHLFGLHLPEDVFHREGYHHSTLFFYHSRTFFCFPFLFSQEDVQPRLRNKLLSSTSSSLTRLLEGHTRPCCFY